MAKPVNKVKELKLLNGNVRFLSIFTSKHHYFYRLSCHAGHNTQVQSNSNVSGNQVDVKMIKRMIIIYVRVFTMWLTEREYVSLHKTRKLVANETKCKEREVLRQEWVKEKYQQ